jgi:hypothetical protein
MEMMEANNGNQNDDMDLDHDHHHNHDQRGLSRGPGGRMAEPRARESRWNRDKSEGAMSNDGDNNSLANRLRNLAGHGTEDNAAGPRGLGGPPGQWQQQNGGPPPFDAMMGKYSRYVATTCASDKSSWTITFFQQQL